MHAVVVTSLFVFISCISAQEQVRMTLLSINHFGSEVDGQYQCYLSDPDKTDTTMDSFRAVDTRDGGDVNNPDPPAPVYQVGKFPYYKVTMNNNANDESFGVFGCKATRPGKKDTYISTTRMRSDADFAPATELFTQTVNVGDRDVSITMYSPAGRDTNGIRWRKDNSEVISSQSGSDTFFIPGPIQLSHAGTYECHYRRQRDRAKQGLSLLLVRACAANRWDPPGCTGVCDSCYHGGVCDVYSGKCICPPGFMGDNCLQACGGNRFGHSCEMKCSSNKGDDSCQTFLFCLVHPFGCRCNTGWKGLSCDTECNPENFGASCLQSCSHCAAKQCDRYTGACAGTTCMSGWIGDSCQECDGNYFGTDCTQDCHCSKENCNRETGLCKPGGCLSQWVDLYAPYSCQTGLEDITYTKMNSGVPVPVTCQAVEGLGGDLNSLQLVLSKDSESLEDDNITAGDRSQDGTTRTFLVNSVQQRDSLHCQLRDESGKLAVLSLSVEVYVLPVLTSAHVNEFVNASSVAISWSAWNKTTDDGDPPLVGYIPYYKVAEENYWTPSEMVSPQSLMYTFSSLISDTFYSFSVSAVREGEGGEGPRSPELSVRTVCGVPSKPTDVTADVYGEDQEKIKLSWKLPSEGISCTSGVIKFTIYYSFGTNVASVEVTDPKATSVILYNVSPGVTYKLYVTLSTSGGESERSDEVTHLVPVLPSLTTPPTLQDITCNSVTMVWTKWTEETDPGTPPITHYISYYRMNNSMEWIGGEKVDHGNADEKYNSTFYNLTEDASYYFTVMPVREGYGGEGHLTDIVQGNTTSCFVDKGASPVTIAVSATLSVLVILLIILATVMVVRRRDKKKHLTTDYETSGAFNNSYVKDIDVSESPSKHYEQRDKDFDEVLYTNVEKPVSIVIANFEKYMRDCKKGPSAKLEEQFELLGADRQIASHVGHKEQNKAKNRFKNMIAYDHSRVVLTMVDGDSHSDYYNANYIKNVQSEVAFIASQGPNKASVGDFWRMVWKENVCNIVMLTNLIEDGKDRCIQYWPPTVGATKSFGQIFLKLESEEQFGDYNIRELQVRLGEDIRTVTNWHFKAWPDKDVPDQPSSLIELARRIKAHQTTAPGHLLVHCSAGVGRTGTFIALYSLMDVMETDTKIDIYGYVELMRQDRINMVQTEAQYKFLHECLLEIFLTGNTKIPVKNMESFDIEAEKENLKKQFKILAKLDKEYGPPHTSTPEESEKSRYPQIIPVDKRRPFLQTPGKTSNSNYINACFVTSYRKKDAFIATQSPLPNTVEDFWRLIYDWKCPLIVMLNQLDPRDQTSCKYWPETASSRFGNMNVMLKEEQTKGIYVHRQFELTDAFNQTPILVHHMELNSWDGRNQQDLTILIRDMEKLQQDYSMVEPTVVHCINGVGRTGVFLTVKSEMERMSNEGTFDIFNTIRQLRGSNRSMVYTEEDYYLCHQLLKLDSPESFYANI